MEEPATWEKILGAILVAGLLFFMWPGVKAAMARSREAPKDWNGMLIPLGAVVLFVIFLIAMV
ncbi:MAG: hypothetical protein H6926_01100 [Chromatiales bacterium]|nr:hypothetical protein [Gammaproteobacteria bacterium]MCP5351777.1 hypothetical protein [Chromatiales bacterium]